MKSKWESPTAQETSCAFGDSHLALPPPKGGWSLCSYACGALTCPSCSVYEVRHWSVHHLAESGGPDGR